MEKTSPQILLAPCQDTLLSRMLLACLLCLSNSISCSVYRVPQSIHFTERQRIFFFFFFSTGSDEHMWPPGRVRSGSAPAHLSSPFQLAPISTVHPPSARVLFRLRSAGGELEQIYFSLSLSVSVSLSIQDATSARTLELTATAKTVFLIDPERRFPVADVIFRRVGELSSYTPHVAACYHRTLNADPLYKLWFSAGSPLRSQIQCGLK